MKKNQAIRELRNSASGIKIYAAYRLEKNQSELNRKFAFFLFVILVEEN